MKRQSQKNDYSVGQAIVFCGLPSSVGRAGAPTVSVGPSVSMTVRATEVYENQLRPAHAVYRGTASAVPQEAVNYQGSSPCRRQGVFDAAFFSRSGAGHRPLWPASLVRPLRGGYTGRGGSPMKSILLFAAITAFAQPQPQP